MDVLSASDRIKHLSTNPLRQLRWPSMRWRSGGISRMILFAR
jgi:hypothetical protein